MDESERPRELSPNLREEESDPSASAIAQDATFYAAMRRAIEKGLEHEIALLRDRIEDLKTLTDEFRVWVRDLTEQRDRAEVRATDRCVLG